MNETTIIAKIKRPNGTIEEVNLYPKFLSMAENVFKAIKKATAEAGRGEVMQITYTHWVSNELELEEKYRKCMLEGGEGYIPDFSKQATWTKKIEIYR